ncbi:unnamed protein product [Mytilus coruscus]|uniref:Endonuclease/exonuclease/phosphatase domain-containing protein n=1 Tax=Mytilus coruscus TaxID=42192 RepID=A0A6J8B9K6_MYTCO|nr:unnamed protein product [Mytilus coruscus]
MNEIIQKLGQPVAKEVKIAAVTRLNSRFRGKPGLVKMSLENTDQKILILRNKHKLKTDESYKTVFIQGAKSRIERLLENNTCAILRKLPQGNQFRLTGNGRILRKTQNNEDSEVDVPKKHSTQNDFSDFDSIRSRTAIDKTVNQHGKSFLEFLNESKTCVLNGRYDSNKDNFTCISGRGKSVVDYMCVPHDVLELCSSFQVITTRSVIEQNNFFQFLGDRSKIPDHSILLAEFKTLTSISEYSSSKIDKFKRFRLKSIPNNFFGSDLRKAALQTLIQRIETTRETQSHVDNIYSDLCTLIVDEMNCKIPVCHASRKTRKRHKSSKPFWNEELGQLWNAMRLREKQFLSFKGRSSTRRRFREEFQQAQKSFDRKLRQCERHYRQSFFVWKSIIWLHQILMISGTKSESLDPEKYKTFPWKYTVQTVKS